MQWHLHGAHFGAHEFLESCIEFVESKFVESHQQALQVRAGAHVAHLALVQLVRAF